MLSPLTHTSSGVLEFDSLRELLRGYAWSPLGKDRVSRLVPSGDGEWIERQQQLTADGRREIEKQKRAIQDSLRAYLRHLAGEGSLQEEFVTIRGERFVVPVKTEQRRRVNGVVHGMSASGQTVFVEPLETIEQNNELVRLLEQEQAEVHRILLEMTGRIAEHGTAIVQAIEVMAEVDLQFAKARFAEDYNCVEPV